jgi:hypothetical protein
MLLTGPAPNRQWQGVNKANQTRTAAPAMMSKGFFTFCQTSRPMRSPPLQCVALILQEKFEDLMEMKNCFCV